MAKPPKVKTVRVHKSIWSTEGMFNRRVSLECKKMAMRGYEFKGITGGDIAGWHVLSFVKSAD